MFFAILSWEYVVIEESEWCPTGIIEHFEKFKMAAISWFQDGMCHNGIFIQQVYIFMPPQSGSI